MANTKSINLVASSSQYLSISDGSQSGLDLASDFTIEFWFKLSQTLSDQDNQTIVDKWVGSGGNRSYYFRL